MGLCALAYSGGLDTSVAIKWIKENYGYDVLAISVDVGEERNYEAIREKALQIGAVEAVVIDARQEFFDEHIRRAIWANLLYEHKYPAFTALARPLLARKQVEVALEHGAECLAHGCTGKGNDQVRFETTYAALAPHMKVLAPVREWGMTRDQEIDYAQQHGIPIPVDKRSPYSVDVNLWGRSIECGQIEDPAQEVPEDAWLWTTHPAKAPDEPAYVTIGFEQGTPVSVNGEQMEGPALVARLNELGGAHGVGRVNMMENRLVGIKSREAYEAPAATILLTAHRDLESLTLDRETFHFKPYLELKYAELVYYGQWFTPLRHAIDAFMAETQKRVNGEVTVKLYKGQCEAVARKSDWSLYEYSLATYDTGDKFDQRASKGFIDIFALPAKVAARVAREHGMQP